MERKAGGEEGGRGWRRDGARVRGGAGGGGGGGVEVGEEE